MADSHSLHIDSLQFESTSLERPDAQVLKSSQSAPAGESLEDAHAFRSALSAPIGVPTSAQNSYIKPGSLHAESSLPHRNVQPSDAAQQLEEELIPRPPGNRNVDTNSSVSKKLVDSIGKSGLLHGERSIPSTTTPRTVDSGLDIERSITLLSTTQPFDESGSLQSHSSDFSRPVNAEQEIKMKDPAKTSLRRQQFGRLPEIKFEEAHKSLRSTGFVSDASAAATEYLGSHHGDLEFNQPLSEMHSYDLDNPVEPEMELKLPTESVKPGDIDKLSDTEDKVVHPHDPIKPVGVNKIIKQEDARGTFNPHGPVECANHDYANQRVENGGDVVTQAAETLPEAIETPNAASPSSALRGALPPVTETEEGSSAPPLPPRRKKNAVRTSSNAMGRPTPSPRMEEIGRKPSHTAERGSPSIPENSANIEASLGPYPYRSRQRTTAPDYQNLSVEDRDALLSSHRTLARFHAKKGNNDTALGHLDVCFQVQAENTESVASTAELVDDYLLSAKAHLEKGEYDSAIGYCNLAEEASTSLSGPKMAEIMKIKADAYDGKGDPARARDCRRFVNLAAQK